MLQNNACKHIACTAMSVLLLLQFDAQMLTQLSETRSSNLSPLQFI